MTNPCQGHAAESARADYMKEAERLLDELSRFKWAQGVQMAAGEVQSAEILQAKASKARVALLEHIQRGAVPECDDGKRVLREVFALCEDTEAKCSDEPGDFARGRRFEAKGIARAIGAWYQEEFCGRSHMGEPAAPAPDHFRDAAKMAPVHCTPTEHDGRIVYEHTSEPIPNADGFVLYAAPAPDRFRAAAKMMAEPAGDRIAGAIHYPECWDTAAYPTIESALSEVFAHYRCTEHAAPAEVPMPEEDDPVERLRFFCSTAMSGQDWLNSEAFFVALIAHIDAREAAGYARVLEWAVSRWKDEVENRPLENKNRRPLDDVWRQVVRFAGGDPDSLLGPSHDAALRGG